jgi:hypothetical protein
MKRIRLRTFLLAMPALALALASVARDVRTAGIYESSVWLAVKSSPQPPQEGLVASLTSASVRARTLADPAVATVPEVAEAADPVGALQAHISVGLQRGTRLFWITAVSDTGLGAARLADAYARAALAGNPQLLRISVPRVAVALPTGRSLQWIASKFLVVWLVGVLATVGLIQLTPRMRRGGWRRTSLASSGVQERGRDT